MYTLSDRITRRIWNAYKGRKRGHRPSKLREVQESIDDAMEDVGANTPVSEISRGGKNGKENTVQAEPSVGERVDGGTPESLSPQGSNKETAESSSEQVVKTFEDEWPQLPGVQSAEMDAGMVPEASPTARTASIEADDQEDAPGFTFFVFDGEDENDYTFGPSKIALANDGTRDCAALFLTLHMSQQIQQVILSQRVYDRTSVEGAKLDKVDARFERKLSSQIMRHERRLRQLQKAQSEDATELASVEQELEKLRVLMEGTQARRQGHNARLANAADNVLNLMAQVNAYLEDAFVNANLLEPFLEEEPETPVEELTVEGEYERLCRQLQEDNQGQEVEIEPLHEYSMELAPPPLSEEEQAKKDLTHAFWAAERIIAEAQAAFERREQSYLEAKHETTEPSEVFDVQWLVHERGLTRALIEAEVAERETYNKAREGGVRKCEMDGNIPSVLADTEDIEDGYQDSEVQQIIASVSRPRIGRWLENITSPEPSPALTTPSTVKNGEWEGAEVGMSDSQSVVAEGREREKIDKWRTSCGL